MVALFVILTIVAFLVVDAVLLWVRRHRASVRAELGQQSPSLAEILPEPELPGGVFLMPSHLWAALASTGLLRIGFDPLIRAAMGEPDWVDVPATGTEVRRGQPLFSARWGARSVLFVSPAEGTVQGGRMGDGNESEDGWVLTLLPRQASADLAAMPMAEQAAMWFSQEWARLRDFVRGQSLQAVPAVALPDGGQPRPGWMQFEPDPTWDRFVEQFLREGGTDSGRPAR